MTPMEDSVVVPIAGDPLLVGALLLRVMAQLDDASGTPAALPTQCATIAGLRALSPAETWRLGGMRKSGLSLVIDTRQLAENLRALRHINEEAALIAYFVRHGASRPMLHAMFHVSHDVIARQRRRLGVRLGQGRPALPEKPTRDAIHRCWAEICRAEPDARRRLVQLHQRFAVYPLVVLHAVIHEFDAPRQSNRRNRSHDIEQA
jgi:hypothetical protein